MNSDFIIDLWGSIRELIPAKDRQQLADILVSVCDEYGLTDGIALSVSELDGELKQAVEQQFGESDGDGWGLEDDYEDSDYE